MKNTLIFTVGLLLLVVGYVTGGNLNNVDDRNIGINGYDPVSYHQDNPKKGQEPLMADHDGVTYRFSSSANRDLFLADPERYIPAYGGWCAWAMLEGEKVEVDPERYKIIDGRTYLFYNSFFTDTLKKWNSAAAGSSESQLVDKADGHWNSILSMDSSS